MPRHRLCAAQLGKRSGSGRHGGRCAPRRREGQHPVHALLRRFPHFARALAHRHARYQGAHRAHGHRCARALQGARIKPRASHAARHRAERRRVLPGARGEQHRLRRAGRRGRGRHGAGRRRDGPRASRVRLLWCARCDRRRGRHGQRLGHRAGGMRLFEREGPGCRYRQALRLLAGAPLPSLLGEALPGRLAQKRGAHRGARPLQVHGLGRRAALPGRLERHREQRARGQGARCGRALRAFLQGHRCRPDCRRV